MQPWLQEQRRRSPDDVLDRVFVHAERIAVATAPALCHLPRLRQHGVVVMGLTADTATGSACGYLLGAKDRLKPGR